MELILELEKLINRCSGIQASRSYNYSNTYVSDLTQQDNRTFETATKVQLGYSHYESTLGEQNNYSLREASSFHGLGPVVHYDARNRFEELTQKLSKIIKRLGPVTQTETVIAGDNPSTNEGAEKLKVIYRLNEIARRENVLKPIRKTVEKFKNFALYDRDQRLYGVQESLGLSSLALPSRVAAMAASLGLEAYNSLSDELKIYMSNDHLLVEIKFESISNSQALEDSGRKDETIVRMKKMRVDVSLTEGEEEVKLPDEASDLLYSLRQSNFELLETKMRALIYRTSLMVDFVSRKPEPVRMRAAEMSMLKRMSEVYPQYTVKKVTQGLQMSMKHSTVHFSSQGYIDDQNCRVIENEQCFILGLEKPKQFMLRFSPPLPATATTAKHLCNLACPDLKSTIENSGGLDESFDLSRLISWQRDERENGMDYVFLPPCHVQSVAFVNTRSQKNVYVYSAYHPDLDAKSKRINHTDSNDKQDLGNSHELQQDRAHAILIHGLLLKPSSNIDCDVDGTLDILRTITSIAKRQILYNLLIFSCFCRKKYDLFQKETVDAELDAQLIAANEKTSLAAVGSKHVVKKRRLYPSKEVQKLYGTLDESGRYRSNMSDDDVLSLAIQQNPTFGTPDQRYIVSIESTSPSAIVCKVRSADQASKQILRVVFNISENCELDLYISSRNSDRVAKAKNLLEKTMCIPLVIDFLLE